MKRFLLISASALALSAGAAAADPISLAVAALSSATTALAGGSLITLGLGVTGLSALAVDFAVRAALGYALNALTAKRGAATGRGYSATVNALGSSLPHQVIYGETRVGGAVFHQTLTSSGTKNDRLHRFIAFAGHEIDSYQTIYLDGQEVTLDGSGNVTAPSDFAGQVRIKQYLGTETQEADTDAIAEIIDWSSYHRALGIAYLYCRFEDAASFPNGIPTVTAKIRGKKVEDTRRLADPEDGLTLTSTLSPYVALDPSIDKSANVVFAADFEGFDPTSADGVIWESGGSATGSSLCKEGNTLVLRAGDGGSKWPASNVSYIVAKAPEGDGTLVWQIANNSVGLWWNGLPLGVAQGTFTSNFAGGDNSGYLRMQGGITAGSPTADWAGFSTASNLRYYEAQTVNESLTGGGALWSENPAMIMRDYLLSDYGLSESTSDINEALFETSADVCDEIVAGFKKYTCNGAFTLDAAPEDIIRNILSSMGGIFWNYQGQWALQAAEYSTPALTLTEDDLRGSLEVATRHSRRDNYNGIKGQFKGPLTDYQPDDYPIITSGRFLSEDNNIPAISDLDLLFTDTKIIAQRIARTALRRNRFQQTVSGAFGLRALDLRIGDNVMLTIDHLGYASKVFEVVDWRLGMKDLDIQVNMILREMDEAVFTGIIEILQDESENNLQDESGNNLEAIVA